MAARKVVDIANDLSYLLSKHGLTVADVTDSTSPALTVGTATANNNGVSIRVRDFSSPGVDSLGSTMSNFSHSVIQIIAEANANPGVSTTSKLDALIARDAFWIFSVCASMGCRVEFYVSDDGSNPSLTILDEIVGGSVTNGNLFATFDPSLKGRVMGQQ